jgi:hypothetical protein
VAVEVVGCKAVGMIRISSDCLPWQGCRELRNPKVVNGPDVFPLRVLY